MSTRSQIHVEETGVFIYKHCDGYPEGVMPRLEPFVRWFLEHRGWDPEYLAAQIVREFGREIETEHEREWEQPRSDKGYRPSLQALGWGLGTQLHGDEEYIYIIKRDRIQIRVPGNGYWDHPKLENTRHHKTVKLI